MYSQQSRWARHFIFAIGLIATALGPAANAQANEASVSQAADLPSFRDLKEWDPKYDPPRTRSGKPDLQGMWSMASLTTMSRAGDGVRRRDGLGDVYNALVIPDNVVGELTNADSYTVRLRKDSERTDSGAPAGDPDASKAYLQGYNNFWIDPGSEFAKINGEYRSSWIVSPASGKVPYTPEGMRMRGARLADSKRVNNTGPEIRTIGDRCIISFGSQAGPPLTNAMYNNNLQIVQTENHVMINVEMNHDIRVIGLNADPRPAALKMWFGDSLGQWEGDTLVVETRNVSEMHERFAAYPISANGKVTERFKRVSDLELFYEFEVTDPVYYSQPWKGEMVLRRSRQGLFEYACHEGNYALPGILRGDAEGRDTALEAEGE